MGWLCSLYYIKPTLHSNAHFHFTRNKYIYTYIFACHNVAWDCTCASRLRDKKREKWPHIETLFIPFSHTISKLAHLSVIGKLSLEIVCFLLTRIIAHLYTSFHCNFPISRKPNFPVTRPTFLVAGRCRSRSDFGRPAHSHKRTSYTLTHNCTHFHQLSAIYTYISTHTHANKQLTTKHPRIRPGFEAKRTHSTFE